MPRSCAPTPPRRRAMRRITVPPVRRLGDFGSFTPPLVSRAKPAASLRKQLVVEPDVFHAPAIGETVDHQGQPLHPRLPAGGATVVEDDRQGAVLLRLPLH